jgi:uncharacterized membrane protein YtjA (UPF0391 family)
MYYQLSSVSPARVRAQAKFERLPRAAKEAHMLWTVFVILLILWLLGFSFHIAGGLIHLLLVVAVVVLIINLISGRRTA